MTLHPAHHMHDVFIITLLIINFMTYFNHIGNLELLLTCFKYAVLFQLALSLSFFELF